MDYIDLYLFHQPFGDYYASYRVMTELYKDGKIRAIGCNNMYPDRLADLCENFEIKPAVNQVELHPFFQQNAALENMKNYGVTPEAWGPFAEGKHVIFKNPLLSEIATLDIGHSEIVDHSNPEFVKMINGWKIHQ